MGTLSYLKTRNLTSLFRFKAFPLSACPPPCKRCAALARRKGGLIAHLLSASRVSRARRDSEDRRANRAASDRPAGLTFHHHDCRRRFAATQTLCPFHRARHKLGQSDKPGDPYPWRSAPPGSRPPPPALHVCSERAYARNVETPCPAPVLLRAKRLRRHFAAPRPAPAIGDSKRQSAVFLPLCVRTRLLHPVFRHRKGRDRD